MIYRLGDKFDPSSYQELYSYYEVRGSNHYQSYVYPRKTHAINWWWTIEWGRTLILV